MNPVDKILGKHYYRTLKSLKLDKSKNNEVHNVPYKEGYGWGRFCSCGKDTFTCQHCGQVKCETYFSATPIDGKNTCVHCFNKRIVRNQPNLKGNPAYDLMI
jgi:hypothetical protein